MKGNEYVLFCVEFICNSDCKICFIDDMRQDKPIPFDQFKILLRPYIGQYRGIMFSGGEVTLNKQLPEYVAYARDKGFSNIRIQTNGRVLADIDKVKQLQSAGVNEFFVSFYSADYELSDQMAKRTGSHAQTVRALENLDKLGLEVITNTVMTSMNYTGLPDTAHFLKKYRNISEMHFWGYVPVSGEAAELLLPYVLAAPYVNRTIKYVEGLQRRLCIKYFPRCLLRERYKKYEDNSNPNPVGLSGHLMEKWKACNFRHYSCCEQTDCEGLPEFYRGLMPLENWFPSGAMKAAYKRI